MIFLEILIKTIFMAALTACLTQMKYSMKKSVFIIAGFHFFICIFNYAFYVYVSKELMLYFMYFTLGIPGFFCFNMVAKYKRFRVLFSVLTVAIFSMFSSFLGYVAYTGSHVLQYALKYGSFILIFIFVAIVFRKPYFKMQQTLEKGWGPLCLIPFILVIIIALLQYVPARIPENPENIPVLLAVYVLTIVFYTIFYFNFENVSQLFQFRKDRQILSLQTEMYKNQYEAMIDSINSMRILRHDMKHYLNAIEAFVNDGRIAKAQKYMRTLNKDLNTIMVEKFCENYVVNVFLLSYIQKARNEQITVDCEAEVPESIQVDPIELGLVFANSLDNAINACKRIQNVSDRNIIVACKQHCGQIFLRVTNPFIGEVNFDGEFPVPESADHGTGTRSIAAITKKYGGVFSFIANDGIFKTTVTLNCQPNS